MKNSFRRNVGRSSLAAAFAAALAISAALPAPAATDTRDQYQTQIFGLQKLIPVLAQTFTAGLDGQLDRVTLSSSATSSALVAVSILNVDATTHKPTGNPLGSAPVRSGPWGSSNFPIWQEFRFDPIPITKGKEYAIVVQSSSTFTWRNDSGLNLYESGRAYGGSAYESEYPGDFAFETWVIVAATPSPTPSPSPSPSPPANRAPSVGPADTAAVVVGEGTQPNNSGPFSDPDGDTVTLTASAGTVTKTGTSSGTWSWSQPKSDEEPVKTITITADDGHGHTGATTFTVRVDPVPPVASIISDPPLIAEGSSESFTGGATVAYPGDAGATTLTWTVTKNGATYPASGSGAAFAFTPDDDGTYVVMITARDTDTSMSHSDSVTVIGQNVAPVVHITNVSAPSPLVAQENVTFTGNFSDPGWLDWHDVTWYFGDGTSTTTHVLAGGATTFSVTHPYTEAKAYTVRLQVVDKDKGEGHAAATVTVLTTQAALKWVAGQVNGLSGLNAGQKNSLIAKLNAASASASRGDNKACNNQLNAFLNELQADVKTGKISDANAAPLRSTVVAIKGSLGTYNRFLEWLPLVF